MSMVVSKGAVGGGCLLMNRLCIRAADKTAYTGWRYIVYGSWSDWRSTVNPLVKKCHMGCLEIG
jgi:hypothetical protein